MQRMIDRFGASTAPQSRQYFSGVRQDTRSGRSRCIWMAIVLAMSHGLAIAGDEPAATVATPAAPTATAQPDAPPPFTADLDLYSDYVERGLSYSREKYSVQGHVEYDFPQGAYGGAFIVHNSEIVDKETVEIDPYAGYIARFNDWTIDTGVFSWLYPHSRFDVSRNRYNTLEATVDVTYKIAGIKFWYDLRDYWGLDSGSALVNYNLQPNSSSQGSLYIDSHLNMPLPRGFLLKLHAGHQFIRNYGELDYTDWMLGFEKTLGRGFTLGGGYSDTDADQSLYVDPHGLKLARAKWLAYVRWAFP